MYFDVLGLAIVDYIGIDDIVKALERLARAQGDNFYLDPWYGPERAMLLRLKAGLGDPADIAFYHHEKAEEELCRPYFNLPDEEYLIWQKKFHEVFLKEQENFSSDLYHQSVKELFPEYFR